MHLWRLILLTIILAAAYGAGAGVLMITNIHREAVVKQAIHLLSVTLGLGILAYSTLAIGLLGWLHPPVLWGMLVLFALAGVYMLKGNNTFDYFGRFKNISNSFQQLDWFYKLLFAFLIIFVLLNLIGALAPPLGVDDLKYHFAIPKRYVNVGAITYIPDIYFSNFPFPMEMLWTLAISIDSGQLAQLINWSISLLVIGWIVILGNQSGLKLPSIIISLLLFYSITQVGHQSRSGTVELGGTLFFLAGTYLLNKYKENSNEKILILSGIICGLFAAVKLPYAAMIILLTIWIGYSTWRKNQSFRIGLSSGVLFGSAALVVVSVWYVKTYFMTGNPVYPFLQSLFGGPPIHNNLLAWGVQGIESEARSFQHLSNIPFSYVSQLWYLIAEPQRLRGHVSPLFLGMMPFVIFYYRKENKYLKGILIIAALFYIHWVAFYPLLRIGLPFFALLSIPVALAIYRLMAWSKFSKIGVSFMLVVFLLTSLGGHLREVIPSIPVILGTQTQMDYTTNYGSKRHRFFHYPAHNYMNNKLPANSNILLWSNDGYYLDRDYLYVFGFITNMADGEKIYDPEQVIDELKKFGITHVAMTDNYLRKKLRDTLLETEKIEILYQDKHMLVASLSMSRQ